MSALLIVPALIGLCWLCDTLWGKGVAGGRMWT